MTWKVWERNFRKGSISYYEWQLAHKLSEQQFYSFDEKFSFFLPSSYLEKLFKDSFVSFHSAIFYIPIEVELERRRKAKTFAYVSLSRLHIFIIRISNGLQMTRKMVAISLTLFLSLFHLSYTASVSLLVSFFPSTYCLFLFMHFLTFYISTIPSISFFLIFLFHFYLLLLFVLLTLIWIYLSSLFLFQFHFFTLQHL
jgi:hypothetical protein